MSITKVNLPKSIIESFESLKKGKKFCDGKPNCISA